MISYQHPNFLPVRPTVSRAQFYRTGFTTLPPVLLQEQSAVLLLLERVLVSWSVGIDEHDRHEDLRSSGRRSIISYVHEITELYCSSLACLSLIFFWPL
jgi:hypothetical protein